MQSDKKREEFAISIRRKQISQKMEAIRSQYQVQTETDYHRYLPLVPEMLTGDKPITHYLRQLKVLSYSAEPSGILVKSGIHNILYKYLIDHSMPTQSSTPTQTQPSPTTTSPKPDPLPTPTYTDILTILINLCVHQDLELTPQIIQITALSILIPDREIISLWFIANIMYQKSMYSGYLAKELVQNCDAVQYMEQRIGRKFQGEGDIVVFLFFCCGFLVVAGVLTSEQVRRIFGVITEILKYQPKQEQNWWYLTQALVDYGQYLALTDYQLFNCQKIMQKLSQNCKQKKSKYIKNYLKMLINFINSSRQQNYKTIYDKLLKYGIFQDLSYCVENRLHQVKRLCGEFGLGVLGKFGGIVDVENIVFFQNLVMELVNLQKYPTDTQTSLLKYTHKFLTITIPNLPSKHSKQNFITQLLSSNIITTIAKLITGNEGRSVELLAQCLSFLLLVVRVDDEHRIGRKLVEEGLIKVLEDVGGGRGGRGLGGEGGMGEDQRVGKLVVAMLGYFEEIGYGNSDRMI